MVTLTLLDSSAQQWQFELHSVISIGRGKDNDLVLANTQVSRHHLDLFPNNPGSTQGVWQLQSHGTNGTLLNGKLVTQGVVSHGSKIQLGLSGPVLKFELPSEVDTQKLSHDQLADWATQIPTKKRRIPELCTHSNNEPGNQFCIHCGVPLKVLTQVRHYQIVEHIKAEAREASFLVRSTAMENAPLQVMRRFQPATFLQAQDRFEQAAHFLTTLEHPGVAKVVDFFGEVPYLYAVEEKVRGQTLEEWVAQTGPISAEVAIATLLSICNQLSELHDHVPPIIHHELAPSNIMLRNGSQDIVLINFGSIRAAGLGMGPSLQTVRADIYRLGTLLLFLLTGTNPSHCLKVHCLNNHIHWTAAPHIPPVLKPVIERATHPKPENRFLSVKELSEALQDCDRALASQ